jgi:hypothetical protein
MRQMLQLLTSAMVDALYTVTFMPTHARGDRNGYGRNSAENEFAADGARPESHAIDDGEAGSEND